MCYMNMEGKVTMEENLKKFSIQDNYDVNILLLGETGVGKSTFINSIANYLLHHDLNEAMANDLFHLIPCMFSITDDECRPQKATVGKDGNEYQLVGDSATQDVRTYVFPIGSGKTRLRLIDTPGMGDPRGVDQDDANCEKILTHIGQYHLLHAICLLFRPNDARVTITFEYCVKQILSRLDKSAAKNIIFIFTNSKATHFKPGETWACLKRLIKDIKEQPPHVDIKVEDNVFCFDNEAFRFLAAKKQGIEFEDTTKEEYAKSWENSSKEAWKLIKFIIGDVDRGSLTPYMVKPLKSVNEARRVVNNFPPLRFDNQALSVHGPLPDNRLPYNNCPPNYFRPPVDNRCLNYSRPLVDNRPPNCTEPPVDDRPSYNIRPPYDSRSSHDNLPPYDSRPSQAYRPPNNSLPPYDPRLPYDSRSLQGNRFPYDNRPQYDSRLPYDNGSLVAQRPGYANYYWSSFLQYRENWQYTGDLLYYKPRNNN